MLEGKVLCASGRESVRSCNRSVCGFGHRKGGFGFGQRRNRVVLRSAEADIFARFTVVCFDVFSADEVVRFCVKLLHELLILRAHRARNVCKEAHRHEILLEIEIEGVVCIVEQVAVKRVGHLSAHV